MPTQEQENEEWVKKIQELSRQNEASGTPPEFSYEEEVLRYMRRSIEIMRRAKPETRGELARRYAVSITEMEKIFAYFKMFVADFVNSMNNDKT